MTSRDVLCVYPRNIGALVVVFILGCESRTRLPTARLAHSR